MDRKEIEEWREHPNHALNTMMPDTFSELCDLALTHADARQEGYREGLKAAKRICDEEAEYRRRRSEKPLPGDSDPAIQSHKQITAHKLGLRILDHAALTQARVEGTLRACFKCEWWKDCEAMNECRRDAQARVERLAAPTPAELKGEGK